MLLFDLDGTLLNSSNIISLTTTAIKQCQHKGYCIGVVTARSRSKKICVF